MAGTLSERVADMIGYIKSGRILDAMSEFYAEDASMQENAGEPTAGLAANIEREKQFLANVAEFHGFEATAVGVDESSPGTGTALIESRLEFTNTQGSRVTMEQVSVQRWADGKIAHERFYYDSAG